MTQWTDIPILPVLHPSSGNLQGVVLPANLIIDGDAIILKSTDPSSIGNIIIGGTPTVGDVLTLNFKYNSVTVPITYTVVSGDTIAGIVTGLCAAITAQLGIGGTLTGQVLYAQTNNTVVAIDFDSRTPMSMTASVSGAHTETIALAATDPTPLPISLDNNPGIGLTRFIDGVPPPAGSVIGTIQITSSQSNSPHDVTVQYGNMGVEILSSVSGTLSSQWFFVVPDVNGNLDKGFYANAAAVYPVDTNIMASGLSAYRWSTVWGFTGDFATGLTVNNKPGLTTSISVRKGDNTGARTLTFTGGILTAVT